MAWQHEWAEAVTTRAAELAGMRSLRVFGSVADGEVDRWSDLDLDIVLDRPVSLADLVPGLRVWGYEEHADQDQVLRVFDLEGHHVDLVVRGDRLTGLPESDPTVNDVRFRLALAAVKLGRGDRLIAADLALGAARSVLLEAMLLRDADTGTTAHRTGTARDAVADEVLAAVTPLTASSLGALATAFDRLHGERDPGYRPDWRGLRALSVANVPDVGHFRHT